MPATESAAALKFPRVTLRTKVCLLAALALVWLLLEPPWTFVFPSTGLDPSWELASVVATLKGARWGTDFVFTCGPLAWLSTRWYVPGGIGLVEIGFHLALDLLTFASFIALTGWRLGATLGAVAVFVFGNIPETQFYLIGPCTAMLAAKQPSPADGQRSESAWLQSRYLPPAPAIVGGIAALSKLSYAPALAFSFLVIDTTRLLRKQIPILFPAFLASAAVGWFASGQHLDNIGAFLIGTEAIIAGYPDAMGISGGIAARLAFLPIAARYN